MSWLEQLLNEIAKAAKAYTDALEERDRRNAEMIREVFSRKEPQKVPEATSNPPKKRSHHKPKSLGGVG